MVDFPSRNTSKLFLFLGEKAVNDLSQFGFRELELAIEQLQILLEVQRKAGKLNAFPSDLVTLCLDPATGEVGFFSDGDDTFYQFQDSKLTKLDY